MKDYPNTTIAEEDAFSFYAKTAAVGTVVRLMHKTSVGRVAKGEFNKLLFEYFESLASGQTGWGIDFIEWLEYKYDWKHHGALVFERIEGEDFECNFITD